MGFLSKLFRSRDKPKNSTAGQAYQFYFGTASSGVYVSERTAMTISAVYACVRILSETLADLPLHVNKYTNGGSAKAPEHPLDYLLDSEPNPEMSAFMFRETMMTHILLWGNAYAQIIRNGKGEVLGLYPLMPDRMTVDRDTSTGRLYYEYQTSQDDAKTMRGSTVRLKPTDVLHIAGLGFDGLVGYSPIAMAKNAVGVSMAAENFGAQFFKNGATPSGVLEFPDVVEDPKAVRESWIEGFSGNDSAHGVAILEKGMKYTPIAISPEQAQFLETRKFQVNEIARIFRIPPHMIGDLEKSSFNNIEQQSLEFVKYTIGPWVRRWEQELSRKLLRDEEKREYTIRFNVDGLLRGDYKTRMEGYQIARQNGWMSANDIRRLEDMELISEDEGGDLYLINGNMMKLEDAGAAYAQGGSGGGSGGETGGTEPGNGSSGGEGPQQIPFHNGPVTAMELLAAQIAAEAKGVDLDAER